MHTGHKVRISKFHEKYLKNLHTVNIKSNFEIILVILRILEIVLKNHKGT